MAALFTRKPVPRAFPLSKVGVGSPGRRPHLWPALALPLPPWLPLSCLLGHRWVPSAYGCAVITALGVNAAEQQPMVLNPSRTGETKKLPSVGKMGLAAGDGPYKWTFLLCNITF